MSLNKVQLIGYIGKDPEVSTISSGMKVAKFQMATSESYKDKSGTKVEKTEWHNIIAWGSHADVIEKYLKKGKQIYVEGKLTTRSWDDKKSGEKKYITEIVLLSFSFLGKKDDSISSQDSNERTDNPYAPSEGNDQTTRYSTPKTQKNSDQELESTVTSNSNLTSEKDDLPF
jgi:single-strand DNA-binding protein